MARKDVCHGVVTQELAIPTLRRREFVPVALRRRSRNALLPPRILQPARKKADPTQHFVLISCSFLCPGEETRQCVHIKGGKIFVAVAPPGSDSPNETVLICSLFVMSLCTVWTSSSLPTSASGRAANADTATTIDAATRAHPLFTAPSLAEYDANPDMRARKAAHHRAPHSSS